MPDPRLPRTALSGVSGAPGSSVDDVELHDRCVRCGRPTPLGVSMCDDDNPGRIGAPSATQLHGTMAAGVGPFTSSIVGQALLSNGGVEVAVQVTNEGSKASAATCHVSRGGVSQADDLIFLTAPVDPGRTATFERTVPPPDPGNGAYTLGELTVTCR